MSGSVGLLSGAIWCLWREIHLAANILVAQHLVCRFSWAHLLSVQCLFLILSCTWTHLRNWTNMSLQNKLFSLLPRCWVVANQFWPVPLFSIPGFTYFPPYLTSLIAGIFSTSQWEWTCPSALTWWSVSSALLPFLLLPVLPDVCCCHSCTNDFCLI